MIGRDLVRGLAWSVGPAVVVRGGRTGRTAAVVGAGLYLSLPVARAVRRRAPAAVLPLLPVALAVKDLSKAVGCVRGLLLHSKP